ncbi:MAG: radical SAM protein [Spirochaetota bacterium]
MNSQEKIDALQQDPVFAALSHIHKEFLRRKAAELRLSFQDLKQLVDIAADLEHWSEPGLPEIWDESETAHLKGKNRKKVVLDRVQSFWLQRKAEPTDYRGFAGGPPPTQPIQYRRIEAEGAILGRCPVAGERTRCCNLQTLDAVQQCGFACSYCSIQSFYDEGRVYFLQNLREKLQSLEIDPRQGYHIGTGQSSDSLMWGNREGLLDSLFEFAAAHPNVVLELKTKSANVKYLLEQPVPPNVVTTWSLNTPQIIENEEHLTASLDERLDAARRVAATGALVGFHFHPIVHHRGWREEYGRIYAELQRSFSTDSVVMVSLGTLTFIKPVIRHLRTLPLRSKILQMPLEDAAGKFSYPFETKLELFRHAYRSFSKEWQQRVFFYMCMEDENLWQPVFGRAYSSNAEFETDMIGFYLNKINAKRRRG